MIAYSIIQNSKLEGALRLDAEYYQPEYLEISKILSKYPTRSIGEIGNVAYGTTPEGGIFEATGIPFVRSQNFSNLTISTSGLVFCSKEFHEGNKKSAIKPGDILFAAVGATIGELAMVQDEIEEGNINQNIARVRIIDKDINPYFVGFFFASKPGQLQIERLTTGNAQPYLNSEQIKSLTVPVLGSRKRDKVTNYFQEIQKRIKFSHFFYQQAESLLLEELGLKDFKAGEDLSYIVNLSEVKSAQRADAEYFQPKYKKLISKIKKQKTKLLSELVVMKKGIEPGSEFYQEEGKIFIRVSTLSKCGIEARGQKYLNEELYQKLKKTFEPKVGEILLTKDATPGIAYVLKKPIEGIIAGGILRLKLKAKIESEYLALVINSIVGQMQAERDVGGSVIVHWRPSQIEKCLIPILSRSVQQKIADLVCQSHAIRKKAKELLEEAKRKVEGLIKK